jgi:hypothetical protein
LFVRQFQFRQQTAPRRGIMQQRRQTQQQAP